MLSKANIKFIKSLQVKKYRKQEQCFTVEGAKSVLELLRSDFEIRKLFGTDKFLDEAVVPKGCDVTRVTERELEQLGEYQSNNTALAIAAMKENKTLDISGNEFAIALDDIRDPGNLGTIIRTADWFGISKVICSSQTADLYNPKVISATMGSFTRVQVFYTDLDTYFAQQGKKVYGAYLDGADVHSIEKWEGGFILIGSESHGVNAHLEKFVTDRVTIPGYGKAESLNAAIATGIICDNIRRSASY
jgi:RNA methyltransferase, TrmH family